MRDNRAEQLEARLATLEAARDAMTAAREAHESARWEVHDLLDVIASERTDEDGVDAELVRRLYWQMPEVHVNRIGPACGVFNRAEVFRHSGDTLRLQPDCQRCGESYPVSLANRHQVAAWFGRWNSRLCPDCAEIEAAERTERAEISRRELDAALAEESER